MKQYATLLGYFDKQFAIIEKIYKEIAVVDVSIYDKRFVFAMKTQQLYTALEDLLKQIAKAFENHIDQMSSFHKEILIRMNIAIPKIRPAVLTTRSMVALDKLRAFRHFARHAYDCELDEEELRKIQHHIQSEFSTIEHDLKSFRQFIQELS